MQHFPRSTRMFHVGAGVAMAFAGLALVTGCTAEKSVAPAAGGAGGAGPGGNGGTGGATGASGGSAGSGAQGGTSGSSSGASGGSAGSGGAGGSAGGGGLNCGGNGPICFDQQVTGILEYTFPACCTPGGSCGADITPAESVTALAGCVELNRPAVAGYACPDVQLGTFSFPGCCQSDLKCGALFNVDEISSVEGPEFGCQNPADFGHAEGAACPPLTMLPVDACVGLETEYGAEYDVGGSSQYVAQIAAECGRVNCAMAIGAPGYPACVQACIDAATNNALAPDCSRCLVIVVEAAADSCLSQCTSDSMNCGSTNDQSCCSHCLCTTTAAYTDLATCTGLPSTTCDAF